MPPKKAASSAGSSSKQSGAKSVGDSSGAVSAASVTDSGDAFQLDVQQEFLRSFDLPHERLKREFKFDENEDGKNHAGTQTADALSKTNFLSFLNMFERKMKNNIETNVAEMDVLLRTPICRTENFLLLGDGDKEGEITNALVLAEKGTTNSKSNGYNTVGKKLAQLEKHILLTKLFHKQDVTVAVFVTNCLGVPQRAPHLTLIPTLLLKHKAFLPNLFALFERKRFFLRVIEWSMGAREEHKAELEEKVKKLESILEDEQAARVADKVQADQRQAEAEKRQAEAEKRQAELEAKLEKLRVADEEFKADATRKQEEATRKQEELEAKLNELMKVAGKH